MEKKSLKSNFIWNSIGSFTYLFCQWLLTFLIIRLSSNIKDAGNLSLAISITNIFFNISCFNLRPYLVSDNDHEYTVADYTTFRLITIVASLILCLGYSIIFRYNSEQLMCIMLYMIYKIGEAIVDLFHGFEQRKSRMDIGGISLLSRGLFSIFVFALGMILFHNVNLSILLMVVITYLFIYLYDWPNVKKFENLKFNFKSPKIKELFLKFLPLAIGTFLSTMAAALPRQILERIYGTSILGIYATIATPAVIVQVAASYIYNPLLVSFSDYRKNNDYKNFRKLLLKSFLVVFIISIICYIGSLVLSEPILNILYGSKISKHYSLFSVIIIYTSLTGFLFFCHNVVIVLRQIKKLLIIYLTGFICCVLISTYFIKAYKMNGVSYSLIIITILMIVEMLVLIFKQLDVMKRKRIEE